MRELKKLDLFDLGVMLTICATGGLEMVDEEDLVKLTQYSDKCCLIHALETISTTSPWFDIDLMATLLSLKRVFERISPTAQEFICLCMQQRFTDKEMAQMSNSKRAMKVVSAQDLLGNVWLLETPDGKIRPNETQMLSTATTTDTSVKLSFKDLLNVSSDWKAINHIKGSDEPGTLNHDFQIKQIDRIIEAIALTLPNGHFGN
jgi:hypothetical protein